MFLSSLVFEICRKVHTCGSSRCELPWIFQHAISWCVKGYGSLILTSDSKFIWGRYVKCEMNWGIEPVSITDMVDLYSFRTYEIDGIVY